MLDLDYTRRHIIFNGVSDSSKDLVMGGNTPIFVPKVKRSSLEVSYADGTVDTSYYKANKILLENDSMQYELFVVISIYNNGVIRSTDEMNSLCNNKIIEVEQWLYSGPGDLIDYGIGYYDDANVNSGNPSITPYTFHNAECTSCSSTKAVSSSEWVIKFSVTFTWPPVAMGERVYWNSPREYTKPNDGIRFLYFNKKCSYMYGLTMHGDTPMTDMSPKISSFDWPEQDGSLSLSHCRLNHPDGWESMFYGDRTLSYEFTKFFSKTNGSGKLRSVCQMNAIIQNCIEEVSQWLLNVTPRLMTVDGNVIAGGENTFLTDSAFVIGGSYVGSVPCYFLLGSRCTSLSANKTEHNDYWGVKFSVTMTCYPIFKTGTINFGPSVSPSQDPVVTTPIWSEYYKIDTTDDPTATESNPTKLYMFQFASTYSSIDEGIYLAELQKTKDLEFTIDSYNAADALICNTEFTLDVEDFTSPSISAQTKTKEWYNFVVGLPPYILITINDVTKAYAPVMSIVSSYTSLPSGTAKWCPGTTKYYCLFESSGTAHDLRTYLFVKGTKVKFKIVLRPLSTTGLNGAFSGADIYQYYQDNDLSITIPLLFDYLSVIPSTDILTAYGIYGENTENTPITGAEAYIMVPTNLNDNTRVVEYPQNFSFVNDYENQNLLQSPFSLSFQSASLINTNCVIVKIPRGHRETENNTMTFVEERTGYNNTYILCDGTKPPERGNVQWLR